MDFELERSRTAGEILSDGLGLFFKRFWLFARLALVTVIPISTALAVWKPEVVDWTLLPATQLFPDWDDLLPVELVDFLIVFPLSTATTAVAVAQLGAGGAASVSGILRRALPVLPAVIGTNLVITLATLGGFVLLIVPGIWLGVFLSFPSEAAAIEKTGVIGGIRRSLDLVRGRFWSTFRVALLIVAGWLGLTMVAFFAISAIPASPLLIAATVVYDAITYTAYGVIWTIFFFTWRATQPPAEPASAV
jgi:hypothetical protein